MTEAAWVAERLGDFGAGVTSVVPGGFAAYARILHPAEVPRNGYGRLVRWAEVASWSGMPLSAGRSLSVRVGDHGEAVSVSYCPPWSPGP